METFGESSNEGVGSSPKSAKLNSEDSVQGGG